MPNDPCSRSSCPAIGTDVCCPVHKPEKVVERCKAIVTLHLEFKNPKLLKQILMDLDSTI